MSVMNVMREKDRQMKERDCDDCPEMRKTVMIVMREKDCDDCHERERL